MDNNGNTTIGLASGASTATVNGALTVTGLTTTNGISNTGNITTDTLTTTGLATLDSLSVTNNASVGGDLTVAGETSLNDRLLMNGNNINMGGGSINTIAVNRQWQPRAAAILTWVTAPRDQAVILIWPVAI